MNYSLYLRALDALAKIDRTGNPRRDFDRRLLRAAERKKESIKRMTTIYIYIYIYIYHSGAISVKSAPRRL